MRTLWLLTALLGLASTAHASDGQPVDADVDVTQVNLQDDADHSRRNLHGLESRNRSFRTFEGWRLSVQDLRSFLLEPRISRLATGVMGTLPLGPIGLLDKARYLSYPLDTPAHFRIKPAKDLGNSDFLYGIYGIGTGMAIPDHPDVQLKNELFHVRGADVIDDSDSIWLLAAWRF